MDISRRAIVQTAAGLSAAQLAHSQSAALTAGQVIDRIKTNVGVPWRAQTVDKIIAGSAETQVKKIATTMMATLDVVQRAAVAGANMVITHEPTFFSHLDTTDTLADDPTYRFKSEFLRKHDMVIFRFHDHWHAHRPDGIAYGMARELGWEEHADPQNRRQFVFPGTPLAQLARDIQAKLNIRIVRVVGDPKMPVNRLAANWGYASLEGGIPQLSHPGVDVLVVGEAREWEVVEYAQDAVASGQKKALIILGHVVSEQAGMKYCAEWLKPIVHEVPVEFVAASEPWWSPGSPV